MRDDGVEPYLMVGAEVVEEGVLSAEFISVSEAFPPPHAVNVRAEKRSSVDRAGVVCIFRMKKI